MSAAKSKYPLTYWSTSKKQEVNIEDMATPHIANALRKLAADEAQTVEPRRLLVQSMTDELIARGCTLDAETGKWIFPDKPGEDLDKEST